MVNREALVAELLRGLLLYKTLSYSVTVASLL